MSKINAIDLHSKVMNFHDKVLNPAKNTLGPQIPETAFSDRMTTAIRQVAKAQEEASISSKNFELGIENDLVIDKKWQSNIPSSLYEAIKVAENSNFLRDAIGNQAYNSILENKEKEWVEHHSVVTDYERKYYMKFL